MVLHMYTNSKPRSFVPSIHHFLELNRAESAEEACADESRFRSMKTMLKLLELLCYPIGLQILSKLVPPTRIDNDNK